MQDMTQGKPGKLIFWFTIPLLIGNIFQQLYMFADTLVVGRTLGATALAAIGGSASSLIFIGFGSCSGLTSGMSALTAQCLGAKELDKVRQSVATSLVITVVTGLLMTVFGFLFIRRMLMLLNTPAASFAAAEEYLQILFGFALLGVLLVWIFAVLRALGDSVTPLYFLIVSNVLNIGLNITFIRCCNAGVAGVAWATVVSQFIALTACVIYSLVKYPLLRLKKADWRFSTCFYAEHLKLGIPMAFMLTVTGAGIAVLQMVMNRFGKDAIAGASTVVPLNNLTFLPIFSIGAALTTYVAQNYGARNLHRIREGVALATKYTLLLTIISGIAAYIFAPWLVGLFIDGEANNEVIDYGVRNLRVNAPLYPLLALLCLFRGVMQGFGLPRSPFFSGIAEMFARIAGAFLLTALWGYEGACLSNPLAWGSGAVFVVAAYIMTLRRFRRDGIPPLSERVRSEKIK